MDKNIHELYKDAEIYLQEFLNAPQKVQQLLLLPLVKLKFYPTIMCTEIKSPIEQIFITAFDLYIEEKRKKRYFFIFTRNN